jgi:hypothetical protein
MARGPELRVRMIASARQSALRLSWAQSLSMRRVSELERAARM